VNRRDRSSRQCAIVFDVVPARPVSSSGHGWRCLKNSHVSFPAMQAPKDVMQILDRDIE